MGITTLSMKCTGFVAASLLFGIASLGRPDALQGQATDIVLRGIPEHKIESYEEREYRWELNSDEAAQAEVLVIATEEGCYWKSRGDREVIARISGGYLIFETPAPSASYLKVVRGISGTYTAPPEIGQVFLEHVSQGLNTISYRGRTVEVHKPERCLRR